MPYLIKTSAMTPAKARALEALAGLAVGGGAGGFLAGKTFQTEKPRYWLQEGQVYGRELTSPERKSFVKRLGKAALLGGTGAAGLSLGVSAIRRRHISARDLSSGRDAYERVFRSLNSAERRQSGTVTSRSSQVRKLRQDLLDATGPGGSVDKLRIKSDLETAIESHREADRVLQNLRGQKKTHSRKGYIRGAERARSHVPWGGKTTHEVRGVDPHTGEAASYEVPSRLTAEGRMAEAIGPENVKYEAGSDGAMRVRGPSQQFWMDLARRTR